MQARARGHISRLVMASLPPLLQRGSLAADTRAVAAALREAEALVNALRADLTDLTVGLTDLVDLEDLEDLVGLVDLAVGFT
jgi:hypothetical protein